MIVGIDLKSHSNAKALFGMLVSVGLVCWLTTPYMGVATASYLLMLWGLQYRKTHVNFHAAVMSVAMLSDIILVLLLEAQRAAVETVVREALTEWQRVHVFSSLSAMLLYIPAFSLGYILLKKPELKVKYLSSHKRIAIVTLILRSIGFLTMFSMLGRGG